MQAAKEMLTERGGFNATPDLSAKRQLALPQIHLGGYAVYRDPIPNQVW